MDLQTIKNQLPEYTKDLKLNIGSVLTPEGAPGLSEQQIAGIALTAALTARNAVFTEQLQQALAATLEPATITGAQTAAAIMAMNNIYYRSLHLLSEKDYLGMPAKLRMNAIARPGVDKIDFELYSLAASAINGCGMCLDSHEKELRKQGLGKESIQSALRIAAVVHAVAVTLENSASPALAQAA